MRVVIGTGGTAGHVFPALAVADRLGELGGVDVVFVGRAGSLEERLVAEAGFRVERVEALPFTRKIGTAALRAPLAALRASRASRPIVRDADVILGMGGYVSVPVALAARTEGVPLVVHEQNAKLGLANRVAARWAAAVALSFRETVGPLPRRVRREFTGNPVRPRILSVARDREALRREAEGTFGLDAARRTVLVMGGSQGARRLNAASVEASRALRDRNDLQLLLLTGPSHHDEIARSVSSDGALRVRTVAFVDRMELAYAAADLVVARAGATTVAEVAACGLPSLLVPYPFATGKHQEANARALQRAGGASVLPDQACTGPALTERIEALIDHGERLEAMAAAAGRFARPDAADALAQLALASARRAAP